jgi:hypothetical protein
MQVNLDGTSLNREGSLYGVTQGVYYGQNERVDELNGRIQDRYFPLTPLPAKIDGRPVSTKFVLYPSASIRKPPATIPAPSDPGTYSPSSVYTGPISSAKGPTRFFMQNIDTETMLRNQNFAIQRGMGQDIYVPSSQSDLYKVTVDPGQTPVQQPNPLLFQQFAFDKTPHRNVASQPTVGRDMFFNNTRTQLRNTV